MLYFFNLIRQSIQRLNSTKKDPKDKKTDDLKQESKIVRVLKQLLLRN